MVCKRAGTRVTRRERCPEIVMPLVSMGAEMAAMGVRKRELKYRERWRREDAAARAIQRAWRIFSACRLTMVLKRQRAWHDVNAGIIQRCVRSHAARGLLERRKWHRIFVLKKWGRLLDGLKLLRLQYAAKQIQKQWKRYLKVRDALTTTTTTAT